jgi:uncharacterized protein YycO
MIVTLAFQKQSEDGFMGKLVEKIIEWKTGSKYFHVEMIIKDKWISSSPSAGAVYIHNLHPLEANYDYVDINIHGARVKKMMKFAEAQVGKKYDWYGILFSQTIDVDKDNKNKWFCSEIVSEMLKIGGYELKLPSNQYSPGDLFEIVSKDNKVY